MANYRINPPYSVKGMASANGVYENEYGAWLGEVESYEVEGTGLEPNTFETSVQPYSEDGDYIPAPKAWRKRVVEKL